MKIKVLDFEKQYDKPIAVALGFFDCIHTGHALLVESAKQFAKDNGVESALLTFSNDPNEFFGKDKQICTFENRLFILEKLGLDEVIGAKFNEDFMLTSPQGFLDKLVGNFDVKCIVVGADYTFGKNAGGNVDMLKHYCEKHGIVLNIVPFETVCGEKLSTTYLKSLVKSGEVKKLNSHLAVTYFMSGVVQHARHKGTGMGFPTVNIAPDSLRLALKDGIYATFCNIDGKIYESMTNVGKKPTFNDNSVSVETYIFDFDGDVYGKNVIVYFVERTRDVTKFNSVDDLKTQLEKDERQIRGILQNCAEFAKIQG